MANLHANEIVIEKQLVQDIFQGKWGLDENQCDIVLSKLRIAQDYEQLLIDLYNTARSFQPKPFEPSRWDDAYDALVQEPSHYLLIENDYVRILEVIIPPGCSQAYHTHQWAGIIIDLVPSDFILYDDSGETYFFATEDPIYAHAEGQPLHATKNIGEVTYIGLHIEIK